MDRRGALRLAMTADGVSAVAMTNATERDRLPA
jgi:hypothetical protein